jgi:four helix bundle protein
MKEPKVFADCYQASIQIFNRTKNFPKALRPTLGRRIEESSLSCLINVRKAGVAPPSQRLKFLYAASESLDELRTLVQFAKDMNAINVAGFSEFSGITKEIGKEIGGFIKHEQRNKTTP